MVYILPFFFIFFFNLLVQPGECCDIFFLFFSHLSIDVWEALDDVNSKVDLLSNRVDVINFHFFCTKREIPPNLISIWERKSHCLNWIFVCWSSHFRSPFPIFSIFLLIEASVNSWISHFHLKCTQTAKFLQSTEIFWFPPQCLQQISARVFSAFGSDEKHDAQLEQDPIRPIFAIMETTNAKSNASEHFIRISHGYTISIPSFEWGDAYCSIGWRTKTLRKKRISFALSFSAISLSKFVKYVSIWFGCAGFPFIW